MKNHKNLHMVPVYSGVDPPSSSPKRDLPVSAKFIHDQLASCPLAELADILRKYGNNDVTVAKRVALNLAAELTRKILQEPDLSVPQLEDAFSRILTIHFSYAQQTNVQKSEAGRQDLVDLMLKAQNTDLFIAQVFFMTYKHKMWRDEGVSILKLVAQTKPQEVLDMLNTWEAAKRQELRVASWHPKQWVQDLKLFVKGCCAEGRNITPPNSVQKAVIKTAKV